MFSGVRYNAGSEEFSRRFAMLFVACGTQEWSYESTKENEEAVLAAGVPIVTFEGYGYHDWTFWRHCALCSLSGIVL